MTKRAQLPDGTTLEFPDETPDGVMDGVVKKHLGVSDQPSKMPWMYEDNRPEQQVRDDLSARPWYSRAMSGAVGGPESVISMATAIPGMAAKGLGTAAGLVGGDSMDEALERGNKAGDMFTYTPRSDAGRMLMDVAGHGFVKGKEVAGDIQALPARGINKLAGREVLDEALYRTSGEALFDYGLAAGPLHGAKAGLKAQRLADQKAKMEGSIAKAEAIQRQLDAEQSLRSRQTVDQPDMYQHPDQMSPPNPAGYTGGRGGGILDPRRIAEIEAEMGTDRPGGIPSSTQPDLFDNGQRIPSEMDVARRGNPPPLDYSPTNMLDAVGPDALAPKVGREAAGGPYARGSGYTPDPLMEPATSDPRVFSNQHQPYSAVSTKVPTSRGINRPQNPEGIEFPFEGASKPGFQRSAEEVMNANEHARQLGDIKKGQRGGPENEKLFRAAGFRTKDGRIIETGQFHDIAKVSEADRPNLEQGFIGKDGTFYTRTEAEVYATGKYKKHSTYNSGEALPPVRPKLKRAADFEFTGNYEVSVNGQTWHIFRDPENKTWYVDPKDTGKHFTENWLGDSKEEALKYLQERVDNGTLVKKDIIDKGPGNKQRGGPGETRNREYRAFLAEAKARGLNLAPEVLKGIWEGKTDTKPTPQVHPQEHTKQVTDSIPGLESLRNEYIDNRPLEQFTEDKLLGSQKDIGFMNANIIGKIINGRFTASDHPLISRVSSEIHRIKDEAVQAANEILHGKSAKNPSEGTYNFWWKQLDQKSRVAINDLGQKLNNEATSWTEQGIRDKYTELTGRTMSQAELKAYQDRVRINKDMAEKLNTKLTAEGKPPIHILPHFWSPAEFDGPFKIILYNKDTKDPVRVETSYLEPNMDKIKKAFPEYDVRLVESKLRTSMDMDNYIMILRQLSKQDRDAASRAIGEAFRRLGLGRHSMKRKGAEGAVGTEGGKTGLSNYERVSEEYIREMHNYMGNRSLDTFYNEVNALDVPNHPFAKGYSLEALDQARGGSAKAAEALDKMFVKIANGTVKAATFGKLGLPEKFWSDMLKLGANIRVPLLIGFFHPIHIGAQLAQHLYMVPAGMRLAGKMDISFAEQQRAVWSAVMQTYKDMVDSGMGKSNEHVKALNDIGALEATVKYDWANYASANITDFKSTMADHLTGVSLLSKIEKEAVRKPAALMTINILKELGLKDKDMTPEMYQMVKQITDKYMVSNRWFEKAHVFSRSGLTGTAFSPLMNFTTTWLGMFKEFTKAAIDDPLAAKSWAPITSFMAINLVTAGLTGMIFAKEYNALAGMMNDAFGTNIPMWEEIVFSDKYMGVKDRNLRYGVLSEAMGLNVGATFNAPTVTGNWAPGAMFWVDIVKAMGTVAKASVGKATQTEIRDATKSILPRFGLIDKIPGPDKAHDIPLSWAGAEEKYSDSNLPYQTSTETASYKRDDKDWAARKLGTYTLKEAEYKTDTAIAKNKTQERSARFTSQMNKIGDRLIVNGQRDVTDLIVELAKDGYSDKDILNGIRADLTSRLVEPQAKMVGQGTSSKQVMIYQLLRDLK